MDAICRRLSGEAYSRDHASWLKQVDSLCQEVSLHLANKVTYILQNRKSDVLPWILTRPKSSEDDPKPHLVVPSPAFQKPKALAPNKCQRMKACIEGSVDSHHAKQAHVNQRTLTHKPVAALDKTQEKVAFGTKVKPKPDKNECKEPQGQDTSDGARSSNEARPALKQSTLFFGNKL